MYNIFFLAFIVVILLGTCHTKKNYQVQMTKFGITPELDQTWMDLGTLRITKKTRTEHVISGTFQLIRNIGNEGTCVLNIYLVAAGDNIIPVISKQGKLCDFIKSEKIFYPDIQLKSNLPTPDTCPFPKGNYTIKDYIIKEEHLPDTVPNGRFKGLFTYKLEKQTIWGINFEFIVTPA